MRGRAILRRVLAAASLLGPTAAQDPPPVKVDLTDRTVEPRQGTGAARLGRSWFENLHLSGFAAFGYLDTGDAGTRPNGGFLIKESALFLEADVWEDTRVYFELQVNRLGRDDDLAMRTGEVYAHFTNVLDRELGAGALGVKLGRIDIPFGEEYLWQDAVDNPLITQSAAYPYGYDEGVLFYGTCGKVGWIASITDGNDARSVEDGHSKAFNLKLSGAPAEGLHVSASAMSNGRAGRSAFEFGGSHIEPVGVGGASSAGSSPSARVGATLVQLDARYDAGEDWRLRLALGGAEVGDDAPGFDRDLAWGVVEALWNLSERVYVVARASEIGTYSAREGYHFDGKIVAGGNAAFGYDTARFQRLSLGAGFAPNQTTTFKLEVGRDRFWLIDTAPAGSGDDDRWFAGLECALRF